MIFQVTVEPPLSGHPRVLLSSCFMEVGHSIEIRDKFMKYTCTCDGSGITGSQSVITFYCRLVYFLSSYFFKKSRDYTSVSGT